MDEKIPPLATYPPPPKPRDPNKGTSPIVFLIAGLVIGGALVLAAVKMTGQGSNPVATHLVSGKDSGKPDVVPNEPTPNAPLGDPKRDAGAKDPKDAGDPKPGTEEPPYNPFEGSIGVNPPPSEMSGTVDSGRPPAMPPKAIKQMGKEPFGGNTKPVDPPETTTPRGYLAVIRLDVENPESAVSAIQGVASKVGGSAIQFDETAKRVEPEGAILFVPLSKAEEAQKLLGGVGSVVVSDTWNGSSGARLDRIENEAQNQLSDLRIKRQELLVKYFEDAPQIKHIDEDADRINKCLAALRSRRPGPDTAVFKIKFLG